MAKVVPIIWVIDYFSTFETVDVVSAALTFPDNAIINRADATEELLDLLYTVKASGSDWNIVDF